MNTQNPYWRSNYLRVAAMVAIGFIVVHLGQALALSNGLSIPAFVSDGLTVLVNGLVIVPLVIAAQDSSAQGKYIRAGWLVLSIAALFYALGNLAGLILPMVSNQLPVISIADILYLLTLILLTVGLLFLSVGEKTRGTQLRSIIDLGIVMIASALVFWILVLAPIVAANRDTESSALIFGLLYPALDFVLLFAVIRLSFGRLSATAPLPLVLLAFGGAVQIISDMTYSVQSVQGLYLAGGLVDTGFIVASGLLGLAGVAQSVSVRSHSQPVIAAPASYRQPIRRIQFLPYVGVAIAYALLALRESIQLPIPFETQAIVLGAIIVLVLIRQTSVLVENGQLYDAAQQEIAERKRAEESLRLVAKALETMNLGATIADQQGNIIYVNPADARMHGYTTQELIGKPANLFALPDQIKPLIAEQVKTWVSWQRESWNIRKDGSTFPVLLISDVVKNADGEPLGTVTICQDITERKQAEEALRRANENLEIRVQERTAELAAARARLHHLLAASPSVIYSSKAEGDYGATFISDNIREMLGYPPEQFIQESGFWLKHIHPDDAARVMNERAQLFGDGANVSQYRFQQTDGSYRWVRDATRLIHDDAGNAVEIVGAWMDMTEQKRAEERQRILYETLHAASGQLDRNAIARAAAETIARQTDYPHICIALPDETRAHWIVSGAAGNLASTLGGKYPMDQGVIGRTFATAQLQWIKDVRQTKHYVLDVAVTDQPLLLSEVAAPIQRGQRLLGVLNVESSQLDAFDQNDVMMIQSLAEIIALALDNAQLYQESAQSEARFRAIFEQAGEGIIITDTTTRIVNSNPAMQAFVGYTDTELQSVGLVPITLPEDATKDLPLAQELLAGKRNSYQVEKRYIRKDGRIAWGRVTVSLIRDASDQPSYGIGMIEDITERRRTDEQLRQLSRAVEQSPSSIVITDPAGNIEYVNPRFSQLTGYTSDEALGKNPRILQSGQTPSEVYEKLWDTIKTGKIWQGEFINRKKNGEVYYELADISPIIDNHGKITHYVAVKQDITERKRLEESIAHNANTMQLLYDTSLEVNAQTDLSALLHTIMKRAAELVKADMGSLHLIDARLQALRLAVGYNLPNQSMIGTTQRFGEDVAGRAAQTGTPVIITDYQHWQGKVHPYADLAVQRMMGMPLQVRQTSIGTIVLADSSSAGPFTPEQIRIARLFADQAAVAIERARLHDELAQLAITDELTGIYNRRGLFQLGEREAERALRFHRPLSAIFFDIDHFREFNNQYGHAVGDVVLQSVTQIAQQQARHIDIVGKYGGEEFVWLLPETDASAALQAAERLRQTVETISVPLAERSIRVTISLGVAHVTAHTPNLAALIDHADQAMLQAKAQGRNQTQTFNQG